MMAHGCFESTVKNLTMVWTRQYVMHVMDITSTKSTARILILQEEYAFSEPGYITTRRSKKKKVGSEVWI